ncbi:MAG: signal peptidase I [Candidatus Hydrogenedentes bacterium]|nr:signal peptidase I [Candidatus Hydrogenedentota bacterium]
MDETLPEETVPAQPQREPESPRQEFKREAWELVKLVALFLAVFWFLITFVVEGYVVQGPSMYPTLEDHERILVFKLGHRLSQIPIFSAIEPIRESDIVVFDSRDEFDKRYIKRVIAVGPDRAPGNLVQAHSVDEAPAPGDVQVEFSRGQVWVDNHLLEEGYLEEVERRTSDSHPPLYLHAGEYYVLGDNRRVSKDSRAFHAVDDSQIIGRAVLRFWPLSRFGFL